MSEPYDQSDNDPGNEGVGEQLTEQDMLLDRGVDDLLDEGYSPPDREPAVDIPTEAEEREGESLDERLAEEVPDVGYVDPLDDPAVTGAAELGGDEESEDDFEVGESRSGRLTDNESDGISDTEKDLVAEDVGIDGAAASAEEAAVHTIDEPASDSRGDATDPYPDGALPDQQG